MRLIERLKKIDEYFENLPQEVFEEKLTKAGFGKIKPGPLAMDDVITEEITEEDMWIYKVGSNNPTRVSKKIEDTKISTVEYDFKIQSMSKSNNGYVCGNIA